MAGGWGWAHKDVTMPVGLNPALDLDPLGIGDELRPATQVERGLRVLRRSFDRERVHGGKLARAGGGKPDALHGHQIFPFVLGS